VAVDPDSEVITAAEVSPAAAADAAVTPRLLGDLAPGNQRGGQATRSYAAAPNPQNQSKSTQNSGHLGREIRRARYADLGLRFCCWPTGKVGSTGQDQMERAGTMSDTGPGPARDVVAGLRERVREATHAAADHEMASKPPSASAVTLSQAMGPAHANTMGNVHGGEVMKLIDTAAGIAASRHAGGPVVTAALDQMSFLHAVHVGDVVFVHATVNDVGRTSMEVGVRVEAEEVVSGRRTHTSSAYLVFVALDEHGHPRPVPPIEPETEVERRRQAEASIRRESRLAREEAIRRRRETT